jgi:hypothetical protein
MQCLHKLQLAGQSQQGSGLREKGPEPSLGLECMPSVTMLVSAIICCCFGVGGNV